MEQLPFWFQAVFSIAAGLICGSFTNVIVARVPQGKSVVSPGSRCVKCSKAIAWHDNVPVLSFLLLRGKCRSCGARISVRYPVIELIVALLFLVTTVRFGFSPLLLVRDWPLMVLFVAITFIDLEHRIIPDALSLGGLLLGLVTSFWEPRHGWMPAATGAALGFTVFYGFAWLYHRITKRHGLGGGDIKLLAMIVAYG
jgi:leader peptidase (prepilin peptidase)/N-methyltransferase